MATFLILAVGVWALVMIVLPQLYMVDYSFHPKLPPSQRGGPKDIYTLANYRYFLFGSPDDTSHWNNTHLHAFWITIFVSVIITIVNFAICYPLAYYMAQVARPKFVTRLMLLLVVPYWINETSARVRVPGIVRHRRRHQRRAHRAQASSMSRSISSARTSRSMRASPTPTC